MTAPKLSRVTIPDVATRTGYSVMAVSYALADKPGVSEGTREYIKKVAHEMGYATDLAARSVRTSKSGIIVILVGEKIPNFVRMLGGFTRLGVLPCVIQHDRDAANRILSIRAEAVLKFSPSKNRIKTSAPVIQVRKEDTGPSILALLEKTL